MKNRFVEDSILLRSSFYQNLAINQWKQRPQFTASRPDKEVRVICAQRRLGYLGLFVLSAVSACHQGPSDDCIVLLASLTTKWPDTPNTQPQLRASRCGHKRFPCDGAGTVVVNSVLRFIFVWGIINPC